MAKLFPRLAPADALTLRESLHDKSLGALQSRSQTSHPKQVFAAVGGRRMTPKELEQIAVKVRTIAQKYGYPHKGTRSTLAAFDTDIAIYLGSELDILPGEAYRPQTWAFISLVLLPDIVKWRFEGFNVSRCTGGRRDCFHRLWLRARAFDLRTEGDNRWIIIKNLTEDSFVSIIERPSLSGNTELCKILGLTWIKTASKVGRNRMEEINRRAIRHIRSKGTIIVLDALPYSELKTLVEHCYEVAAESDPINYPAQEQELTQMTV